MKRKLLSLLFAAAVMSAAALTGCGQSGGTSASQDKSVGKTAEVTISAVFPGSGGAVKSLIPSGTQSIEVYASSSPQPQDIYPGMPAESLSSMLGTLITTLTSSAPTATVKMSPGEYYIMAIAWNSTDVSTRQVLSLAKSAGTIVAGANSVELNFINGTWTLTDASGAALTLSDGTVVKDMVIGESYYLYDKVAVKSAIDSTKPSAGLDGLLRFRFNNNTSARTYGYMESQFNGATKPVVSMGSDMYNITRKCSSFTNYTGCQMRNNDRGIFIVSASEGSTSYYSNGIKQGNAYELLPNKGRTAFSQNGSAIDLSTVLKDATITGGKTIAGTLMEIVATTDKSVSIATSGAVAAKSVNSAVKSVSSNTPYNGVTVTDYEYAIYNLNGGTNKGTWLLYETKLTGDGKTYYTSGYLSNYDPVTYAQITPNAGDYSYGLVPTSTNLGEYCHQLDYQNKTCLQQKPSAGDVYYPWNFWDLNGDGVIDYGSFAFQFYIKEMQTFNLLMYPFTATGK